MLATPLASSAAVRPAITSLIDQSQKMCGTPILAISAARRVKAAGRLFCAAVPAILRFTTGWPPAHALGK